jgi:prophage regulatory protein
METNQIDAPPIDTATPATPNTGPPNPEQRRAQKRSSKRRPGKAKAKRKAPEPSFGELPDDGYIRAAALCPKVLPWNVATLWDRSARGVFPKPIKMGPKITAWRVGDVRAWIAEQAALSRATPRRMGRMQKKSTTEGAPVAEGV